MKMTNEEQSKDVVRKFWEQVYNEQDPSAVPGFFTEDATISNGDNSWSVSEYEEYLKPVFEAFPDYSLEFEEIFADGNKVAFQFSDTGSLKNEFGGLQPTGESFENENVGIAHIQDGKMSKLRYEVDTLSFMQQMDVLDQMV